MSICENCEENQAVNFCPSCNQNQCQTCISVLHQFNNKKPHLESLGKVKSKEFYKCKEHNNPLISFCTDCKEFICYACCLKDGKHESHNTITVKDNLQIIQKYSLNAIDSMVGLEERMVNKAEVLKKRVDAYLQTSNMIQKFLEERKNIPVSNLDFAMELFQFSKMLKEINLK